MRKIYLISLTTVNTLISGSLSFDISSVGGNFGNLNFNVGREIVILSDNLKIGSIPIISSIPKPKIDSDGDGVLDNIDNCPNIYGNQSNGYYMEISQSSNQITTNITTISAIDINENNLKEEYKINYTKNILKEIIDEDNLKTIQAKEVIYSDGEISQTKIKIPKNTQNSTLTAIVEINSNTNREITILKAEDKVNITLLNNGGFYSKVTNKETTSEVKVNANAETEAKIIVQKKVEVTIKTPKGAEIKQENSGKVTSNIELKADTSKGIKPVQIKMSAEINGNLITVANITDNNGRVNSYQLELPNGILSGNMELVKSNIDDNTYSAIKSTFKTSNNFILNKNSRRVIVEDKNIQIIATSAWQQFEEKQYFNGKRTIMLVSGTANIIEDGEESQVIKGVEYELLPPSEESNSSGSNAQTKELTKIYNDSYLNIRYGWNLITTPIDKALNIAESFKYATLTYKYTNCWIKNPKTLNQNEGLWVNYSSHVSDKIKGDSYYSSFNNSNSSWNLFGVGRDTNLNELSQFSEVWVYDSKVKSWIKNPNTIYRGYGFWAKF